VIALAIAVLLSAPVIARQDAPAARSPRNASYVLSARLDPAAHGITGTGRLNWRNITNTPATELRFHLYWNAWRDPSSTWLRELAMSGTSKPRAWRAADAGSIDVTRLTLQSTAGPIDLLPRARYAAPDDGNPDDRTVLAVPLDRPIAPGETVELDLGWNARVPRAFARTGVIDDYFFIAQWFPKIGVLEDGGWNCHQFHAATEFFSDYGTYDVSLTVPAGWIVGATGRQQARTENPNGTATHRYTASDVHDFAWTTSPDLVEVNARFDDPNLPPVDLRLLLQPEHRDQAERHFEAARYALAFYGRWFGAYPYGHLTIVDPVTVVNARAQGGDTSGMEYPTLITAGTRWFSPWRSGDPAEVIIHEIGHQFWYGIVGTNEFEHAWMDEGINTYATARVMEEAYPGRFIVTDRYFGGLVVWSYDDVRWTREVQGNRLNRYRSAGAWDDQRKPTWRYWPGTASATTYARTALWLSALERMLGWDTMQRALSSYFARGTFRHPPPEEFIDTITAASGRDLSTFFDVMYRGGATFDYAVGRVSEQAPGVKETTVIARRLAEGVMPVDVKVTFADGSEVRQTWDGRDRWRAFQFRQASPVASVEIDPDRVLTLDVNYTNNSWTAHPRAGEAARKWATRWLTWFENVLLTYAFFA
jgi:aminopeptidase N